MNGHYFRFDKKSTYVFIDCETLNLCLNSVNNLPWQVSMIKSVGGKKTDQRDFHVKWDTDLKISKDAARITRFDAKKLERIGKKPEEVLPEVIEWLDDADYIVGHNVLGFDMYLIRGIYKFFNKNYKHLVPKVIDTLSIARGINNDLKPKNRETFLAFQFRMLNIRKKGQRNSLEAIGKSYAIEHDYSKLHDAIVDLELNLKVWNKLKYEIDL